MGSEKGALVLLLKVENLTYEADKRTILDDINLNIEKGETIAIIGPSGSGKSTLLKQLNNLISPTKENSICMISCTKITLQKN